MIRWLRPLPFFLGFASGLAALAFLGFKWESPRLKADFVRVHQLMDIESGYYLTARQMISIMRSRMSPDIKVYVVVGGSSILNGTGQHRAAVWSTHLQQILGPDFKVVNFALRGGLSHISGNIAAEWLLGQGKAVIYIGDYFFRMSAASTFYTERHRYLMADAWERGYLLPLPGRAAMMRTRFDNSDQRLSMSLGAMLNRFLFFNDLWSTFSYEIATPNWNFLLAPYGWYSPRKNIPDNDLSPEQRAALNLASVTALEQQGLRRDAAGPLEITPAALEAMQKNYLELVPARLREATIGVSITRNPKFLDELEPEQKARLVRFRQAQVQAMATMGIPIIDAASFVADDFADSVHMSPRGGEKLARMLAPKIIERSQALGYLP